MCGSKGAAEQKSVAVIGGAGASALPCIKELHEQGIKVQSFEAQSEIGGVYAKSFARHMQLTTSSILTPYSDFPHGDEAKPIVWTMGQYRDYMTRYAEANGIKDLINFNTKVEKMRYDEGADQFVLSVCNVNGNDAREVRVTNVVVCTGTHSRPVSPEIPGQDKFKGQIIHSEQWRSPDAFKGKKVLVVGSGEMAADLTLGIAKAGAASLGVAIRGTHGHLIPRTQADGQVTDRNTNRCRYANHYSVGAWVGFFNMHAKRLKATISSMFGASPRNKLEQLVTTYNLNQGTSAYQKFGCKTTGFVEAICCYGAKRLGAIARLEPDRAILANGEEFECDMVLLCTGFRPNFDFLKEDLPEVWETATKNPNSLWKRMFVPKWGTRIAWMGFARPAFGALPPVSEMQSRYYAMALSGQLAPPSEKQMEADIAADLADQRKRFPWDQPRLPGLVDMLTYNDDLARRMGVMPNLWNLFFTRPRLWYHLFFSTISGQQYRLVGPGKKAVAEETLLKMPVGDLLETSVTLSLLVISSIVGRTPFEKGTQLCNWIKCRQAKAGR